MRAQRLRSTSPKSPAIKSYLPINSRHSSAAAHPLSPERIAALKALGVMDRTQKEEAFDDLARLAAHICETKSARITLIDDTHEWHKASYGIECGETAIADSICAFALNEPPIMIIEDLARDPRFYNSPAVTGGPRHRFYAGGVLMTSDGIALGTICVVDDKPRKLTSDQQSMLLSLARQTMALFELRRSNRLASEVLAHSRQLNNMIGHDIKQPLQLMVMAMDRIRTKLTDTRDSDRIDQAINAGMSIGVKLDEAARVSRLQAGLGEPQLRIFPVTEVMRSIETTWRERAAKKGLSLRIQPCTAQLISDPAMLGTIIGNLVANAVKYTSQGRIVIGCRRHGGSVSIEVIDTGPGMNEAVLNEAFQPLGKHEARTEGLGIGLAYANKAAALLNHQLTITSKENRGTHARLKVAVVPSH